MIKTNKQKGFSFFETIICILVFSILVNISFLKYKDFKEKQAIAEAKIKINETFFSSSIEALKHNSIQTIHFDLVQKKINILNQKHKIIQTIILPKNLNYFHTYSKNKTNLEISFTRNGNISTSFSIYFFNSSNKVRYKISFYGFHESKFLKINNYRKLSNNEILLNNILDYHEFTNKHRELFYKDWRKE